jgi:hypothetical protein
MSSRPNSPSLCAEERAFRLHALMCALFDPENTARRAPDCDREDVRGNLIRMALDETEALTALYKPN